jgi:hypothetical protein
MFMAGGVAVGRVGRSLGRVMLAILAIWVAVPVLAVFGFLGWAAVAASFPWNVVFAAFLVGMAALAVQMLRRLGRRDRE